MNLVVKSNSVSELLIATKRNIFKDDIITSEVRNYLKLIKDEGDNGILKMAKKFDNYDNEKFKLDLNLIDSEVKEDFRKAYFRAKKNIKFFHENQRLEDSTIEVEPNLLCGSIYRPFQRVGLYIPGGRAPLISTLMMTIIPAQIAGVKDLVVATPPFKNGTISNEMSFVLKDLNINEVYSLGGVQAIGALAIGTDMIPKVEKICGPGNRWVTEAKRQAAIDKLVSIDFDAGPSEILVIADTSANPDFIASDLLSQLEHGPDSKAILVTSSKKIIDKVNKKLLDFSRRFNDKNILGKKGEKIFLCLVKDKEVQFSFTNEFAPEHLSLQTEKPRDDLKLVQNAGCVFLGHYTPESLGDYASGTNHVLPTGGEAKFRGGLGVSDFLKRINFQEASSKSLRSIGPTVETLANIEGLPAHTFSISIRMDVNNENTLL